LELIFFTTLIIGITVAGIIGIIGTDFTILIFAKKYIRDLMA
jgi:hypothetical protein